MKNLPDKTEVHPGFTRTRSKQTDNHSRTQGTISGKAWADHLPFSLAWLSLPAQPAHGPWRQAARDGPVCPDGDAVTRV